MKKKENQSKVLKTHINRGTLGKMAAGLLAKGKLPVVQQPEIPKAEKFDLRVGIINGKVVVSFGRAVTYLELTPEACERVGNLLLSKARLVREGLTNKVKLN